MNVLKKGFAGVMAAFAISALSPVLIPFAFDKNENLNGIGYAAGAMFWMGLAAGIAGYIMIYLRYKKIRPEEKNNKQIPIPLRFFSNRPAKVMDGILIVGLAGMIYCIVDVTVNQGIAIVFLLMVLTGVYAHFLLNGDVYQYIWNYKSEKKKIQSEEGEGRANEKGI